MHHLVVDTPRINGMGKGEKGEREEGAEPARASLGEGQQEAEELEEGRCWAQGTISGHQGKIGSF